ncbi:Hypothetical predicted protein [Octopus vulgaris]|uniref:Uncharacterized protein n=1 Tax=Octopus vulgaris TaxID=6645 RepID=A0AA36B0C5_OCTVU|nr:Hypothetical predicted protein [Octopus vulgaris]
MALFRIGYLFHHASDVAAVDVHGDVTTIAELCSSDIHGLPRWFAGPFVGSLELVLTYWISRWVTRSLVGSLSFSLTH